MIAIFAGCFIFAMIVGAMLQLGIDPLWGFLGLAVLVLLLMPLEGHMDDIIDGVTDAIKRRLPAKRRDS